MQKKKESDVVALDVTAEELLMISVTGALARITILGQIKPLSESEKELGSMALKEIVQHSEAMNSLQKKVHKIAEMQVFGEQYR